MCVILLTSLSNKIYKPFFGMQTVAGFSPVVDANLVVLMKLVASDFRIDSRPSATQGICFSATTTVLRVSQAPLLMYTPNSTRKTTARSRCSSHRIMVDAGDTRRKYLHGLLVVTIRDGRTAERGIIQWVLNISCLRTQVLFLFHARSYIF